MDRYRSLVAWQRAHALAIFTHRTLDRSYRPQARALFDQLRRAVISVEANIVEGYALATPGQFSRHLKIAMGSAAEAECLVRLAAELEYLPKSATEILARELEREMATLTGLRRAVLRRSPPLPSPLSP